MFPVPLSLMPASFAGNATEPPLATGVSSAIDTSSAILPVGVLAPLPAAFTQSNALDMSLPEIVVRSHHVPTTVLATSTGRQPSDVEAQLVPLDPSTNDGQLMLYPRIFIKFKLSRC